MTNEKKERLKQFVQMVFGIYLENEGDKKDPDLDNHLGETHEAQQNLLSLIDRVPSEEDKAEIDNWMRSLRIGDPESDDDALHVWHILTTIRKALGLEGKE